ncbi:hypothetical protein [Microbispora bryophytorum]|uniref:Uncharacterized protein n=1 Tax=Microbispora bryophytorum TaxID=1460882 RepID=A0A8H9GZZ6_9ACTN|nr:hypothetical protein [Microbispora bryophytorum]MBD3138749.1 hypothetical protein [Microbispora bryophytorum]GGO02418.1 hypothetical protein GCM10011574_11270 [Microbispora bryophytorum]
MAPRHKYEHPLYQEFRASAPRTGLAVDTPLGPGTVVGHNARYGDAQAVAVSEPEE